MTRLALAAALALVASPVLAQDNPFKLPKNKIGAIDVSYTYAGDMQGTAERAISKDRMVSHENTTSKFFGKTTTTDSWFLFTPDSAYTVDLTKKTCIRRPNMLPYMEKAYDDLDGASKQRLHQNMRDMAQMITRAFGTQALGRREGRDQDLRRREVRGALLRELLGLLDAGRAVHSAARAGRHPLRELRADRHLGEAERAAGLDVRAPARHQPSMTIPTSR